MARNVSDEELQLKKRARRRLVGAIVLVTAVAVVLPMILDSEPKPTTQAINIQIPSPDAGVLSSKALPLQPAVQAPAKAEAKTGVQSTGKPEVKPDPVVENSPEPAIEKKPAPEPEAKKSAPGTAPAPPAKPETKKAGDSAKTPIQTQAAAGGFVIQVVALSDAARARELQAKIAAGGLKAYTEVVQTAKGAVTRVRVGPYPSREAADKARQQLQGLGLDGKVVPK